jgi:hypothetical protein
MRSSIPPFPTLALLVALTGCGAAQWETGSMILEFGDTAPWPDAGDGSYGIEDLGDDAGPTVSCSSRPDNSEDGEFNVRAAAQDLEETSANGLSTIQLHVRKMAFTGDGETSFWHGDDYGFIDLSMTTPDGDRWSVPYHDPDQNTCDLTLTEGGRIGHAECLDLPLDSDDFTPGEDDQPEARADLVFDWECGLDP